MCVVENVLRLRYLGLQFLDECLNGFYWWTIPVVLYGSI